MRYCHGSAKHDLPDFKIISPNLPDSYEHEYSSKNDNRNVRRRMFLMMGDEPWHSHIPKKGVFVCLSLVLKNLNVNYGFIPSAEA